MKLFRSFIDKSPNKVFISIILGALAGLCYALIIPLILTALKPKSSDDGITVIDSDTVTFLLWQVSDHKFALLFVFICLFILFARTASQVILTRVSMDVTSDLRVKVYKQIMAAKTKDIENVGPARLIASLTSDIPGIIAGARILPDLLVNVVTLIGMLSFLLYLNSNVFWFVIGCIFFGVLTYQLPMIIGRRYIIRSRTYLDSLHESIRGLIYGIKELKLNKNKSDDYFDDVLVKNEHLVKDANKTGHTIIRIGKNYGDLLCFFVIGAVSFIFVNHHSISDQELIGVIMALLYVTGPIGVLLDFIPDFTVARVLLKKVNALFQELPSEDLKESYANPEPWNTLRFKQIKYQYKNSSGEEGFTMGPVDLEINKGEITYIVGGNGSGKSTLSKLITLHYQADDGDIYFDNSQVTKETINSYRQDISALYSEYYLFDQILGMENEDLQEIVDHYLNSFELNSIIDFKDGVFSSLKLSDGQKRRLALLVSFIEDKELYLFDEWAANQDPAFKEIFYKEILVQLKEKGKAVVVITHDDRYFNLADRKYIMNDGEIVGIEGSFSGKKPTINGGKTINKMNVLFEKKEVEV